MSASPISIAAPMVPGIADGGAGATTGAVQGGFEAVLGGLTSAVGSDQVLGQAAAASPVDIAGLTAAPLLSWEQLQAAALTQNQVGDDPAGKAPAGEISLRGELTSSPAEAQVTPASPAPQLSMTPIVQGATPPAEIVVEEGLPAAEEGEAGDLAAAPNAATPADSNMMMAMLAPVPTPAPAEPTVSANEPTGSAPPPSAPPQFEAPDASSVQPAHPAAAQAAPAVDETPSDPKLEAFAEKALADAKPAPAAAKPAAHPTAIPATPAGKTEPAPVAPTVPVAQMEAAAVVAEAAVDPAPAPAAKSEKPVKGVRAERSPVEGEDASAAGQTRNPQSATPAVSAAAQMDLGKGKGPSKPEVDEVATSEAAANQPEPVMTAEAADAPAVASSAAAPQAAAGVRGSPETVANLAAQIAKKLGARTTQFDVQLDPLGLGRVNVRVEINADGRVSAAMSCENPQAAAELKSRSNELQRALAQSGFDVSGGLSFDVAQDRSSWEGQQHAFQGDDKPGHAFRGRAFAAALETAGDAAQAALAYQRSSPSGVDVRI